MNNVNNYPVEAFPAFLRDAITAFHEDTQIPIEMIGSTVLAAFALALQPLVDVPVILRECAWHQLPFGSIMAATIDGKLITRFDSHDEGYVQVVRGDSVLGCLEGTKGI
ncbi:hypothetical protein CSC17_2380 [Klebsiella oxytoca]|uniref:hypothetical protein n=1 Tax=Klebsiella oxytoca TaxID=571 RepID=UPI000D546D68|nr:hypothetical protein CSC17_2380 [Klebsiella oxytoca]